MNECLVWSGMVSYGLRECMFATNGLLRFWRQIERVMINNNGGGSKSHLNTLRMRNAFASAFAFALHATRRKRSEPKA